MVIFCELSNKWYVAFCRRMYSSRMALNHVIVPRMNIGQKDRSQVRFIGWLLIAALFVLTVQPMHVHLEHNDAASAQDHEHVIDLHFSADNVTSADHNDAVFPVTPEGMLKKSGDNFLLAAIIICLSFLLLGVAYTRRQRLIVSHILPRSSWYSIAPPLRAPPCL